MMSLTWAMAARETQAPLPGLSAPQTGHQPRAGPQAPPVQQRQVLSTAQLAVQLPAVILAAGSVARPLQRWPPPSASRTLSASLAL